jgi:hypothetical protein
VAAFVIIGLAIGVFGKQPHRYYVHLLISAGILFVLVAASLALNVVLLENPNWMWLSFIISGLAWAIPIVIVASGYERKALYRLIPGKRAHERA